MAVSHPDVLEKPTIGGSCMFRYSVYSVKVDIYLCIYIYIYICRVSEHASTTSCIVLMHHGGNQRKMSWMVSSMNGEIDLPAGCLRILR